MGVGRRASLAAWLWAGATALAAGLGPPLPWPWLGLALAAPLGALLATRAAQAPLAAALLAVAGAPLWIGAGSAGGLLGASVCVLATLSLLGPTGTARALPLALVGLGAVEGARQAIAAGTLSAAAAQAAPLALAGLAAGGAVAGALSGVRRSPGLLGLALLLAAGIQGARLWPLASRVPPDAAAVEETWRAGLLRRHLDGVAADPRLTDAALALDPGWHALALAAAPTRGFAALLEAGWAPEGAPLSGEQRADLARRLDEDGQGGRAARLLAAGASDPLVAWRLGLQRRLLGWSDAPLVAPPTGVLRLPGERTLDWRFDTNGQRTLDLHADVPLAGLELSCRGTAWQGAPSLLVGLDRPPLVRLTVPVEGGTVALPGPVAAGPHRLIVAFDNDRAGEGGDRNVAVSRLAARAAP